MPEAKKEALAEKGYTGTKEYLEQYMLPDRMIISKKYSNLTKALHQLNLDEIETLLDHLKRMPAGQNKFLLRNHRPDETVTSDSIRDTIESLEKRREELKVVQSPPPETKLASRKQALDLQKQILKDLFLDSPIAMELLKAIRLALETLKSQEFWKQCNINPNSLTGRDIQNILLGIHPMILMLKQKSKTDSVKVIKDIQDCICGTIAKEVGFPHLLSVRDEVYHIEKTENVVKRFEELVERNEGFDIHLLQQPEVIAFIKSIPSYRELISWAANNPKTERAKKLEKLFSDVENGNITWFAALGTCMKSKMNKTTIPMLPTKGNETMVNVVRLFLNRKNTDNRFNGCQFNQNI